VAVETTILTISCRTDRLSQVRDGVDGDRLKRTVERVTPLCSERSNWCRPRMLFSRRQRQLTAARARAVTRFVSNELFGGVSPERAPWRRTLSQLRHQRVDPATLPHPLRPDLCHRLPRSRAHPCAWARPRAPALGRSVVSDGRSTAAVGGGGTDGPACCALERPSPPRFARPLGRRLVEARG